MYYSCIKQTLFICGHTAMTNEGSVTELFEYYYTILVSSLPMQDAKFLDDLCNHGLICEQFKDELKSLTQCNERASYFLDHKIKPGLATGDTANLFTLFAVMKNCSRDDVKDLAKQIKGDCIIIDKCKFYVLIGSEHM